MPRNKNVRSRQKKREKKAMVERIVARRRRVVNMNQPCARRISAGVDQDHPGSSP